MANPNPMGTRRHFLRIAALLGTGAIVTACGASSPTSTPASQQAAAPAPATNAAPTAASQAAPATATKTAPTATPQAAPTAKAAPASATTTTVKFQSNWYANSNPAFFQLLIDDFAKKDPSIKIDWIKVTPSVQAILTAVAGGTAPDVYHLYTGGASVSSLAPRNALQSIDDLVKSSNIDMSDYLPEEWAGVKYQGKYYALPSTEGGGWAGFSWNKTLADQAGVSIPDAGPTNWQDIAGLAPKLTKKDESGNIQILGFDPLDAMGSSSMFWSMYFQSPALNADKTKMLFNQGHWADALTTIATIYKSIGPEQIGAFWKKWDKWTGGTKSGFANGQEVMISNGYWQPGELGHTQKNKDWVIKYSWIPTVPEGKKFYSLGAHQLVVPRTSKIPNQAFTWMSYIISLDANVIEFNYRGGFLWSKSLIAKIKPQLSQYPGLETFLNMPTEADKIYTDADFASSIGGEIETLWGRAIQEVYFNQKTPEAALNDINTQLQKDLDAANKQSAQSG